MTHTAKKLMDELERLPADVQEERASSYLEDLRQRRVEDRANNAKSKLYEPFRILQEADLDLPPDYSETYEEHLYGITKHD